LLAAALATLCAAGLVFVAASNQTPGLPAEVPWPFVFGAILGTPAVIGALGAVSGRRVLLVAAGILCVVDSILSFSGVTLVFLVPALIFFRAAAAARRHGANRSGCCTGPPWRRSRCRSPSSSASTWAFSVS
jgi:hypothetical protein